jgi:hypothetical protein
MPKGGNGRAVDELAQMVESNVIEERDRVTRTLSSAQIEAMVRATFSRLEKLLEDPFFQSSKGHRRQTDSWNVRKDGWHGTSTVQIALPRDC